MRKIRNYLKLLMTWLLIVLIQSCNSDKATSEQNLVSLDSSDSTTKVENFRSDTNISKEFKIDSSDFMIRATESNWRIRLEQKESFENQFNKISETFMKISKERNLNSLNQIGIQPINDELILDIASIPEIQTELIEKSKNGIVNSMGIVSPNAYKSRKLKMITGLFLKYNLEPYAYYIDKCRPEKNASDTTQFTMHCATIYFKLRKVKKE